MIFGEHPQVQLALGVEKKSTSPTPNRFPVLIARCNYIFPDDVAAVQMARELEKATRMPIGVKNMIRFVSKERVLKTYERIVDHHRGRPLENESDAWGEADFIGTRRGERLIIVMFPLDLHPRRLRAIG